MNSNRLDLERLRPQRWSLQMQPDFSDLISRPADMALKAEEARRMLSMLGIGPFSEQASPLASTRCEGLSSFKSLNAVLAAPLSAHPSVACGGAQAGRLA